MLRKVFFFLFLIVFSVNGNLIGDDINSCPTAADDGNILNEGGITNGNVLSNDIDLDGDLLQIFSVINLPDHGSLTFESNGDYTYQHAGDEFYSDLFTYVMTDGVCFDTADVVISITPVNDKPVVVQDTFYVNEGDTLVVLNSDSLLIVKNDLDTDNINSELRAVLTIPPFYNEGIFSIGNRGAFTYIHGCNDATLDVFQYKVNDGLLTSELQDSVIIFIQNEAPFGEPDMYSVDHGATLNVDELNGILLNDVDSFVCDTLRVTLVQPPSMHIGTFSLDSNGTFIYIHDGTFIPNQDYFVYQLSDGQDNAVETDTVFISINSPSPTTSSLSFAVDEGKELVVDSSQEPELFRIFTLNDPVTTLFK